MPSYNLVAFTGLSMLVASSGALPQPIGPAHGPFNAPPHVPHGGPIPTGISGGPTFPTGPLPTGFGPLGTASIGLPVLPTPTADTEKLAKRFEGARVEGPCKQWQQYEPKPLKPARLVDGPKPPAFVTGGPFPTGTQGPPIIAPTGGPPAGPTGW